jgi:hypothetical protein
LITDGSVNASEESVDADPGITVIVGRCELPSESSICTSVLSLSVTPTVAGVPALTAVKLAV